MSHVTVWPCSLGIYYQRVFRDGNLDPQTGIYRDAENGACEICMVQDEAWKERVVDKDVVYSSKFQVVDVWNGGYEK